MKYFVAESVMKDPLPCTPETLQTVYLPGHIAHIQNGIQSGMVLLAGPIETGGYIILRGETREEVDAYLAKDPFLVNGCNSITVKEFFHIDRSDMVKDW